MSDYELGRDLQDLRSRLERLEHGCDCHGRHGPGHHGRPEQPSAWPGRPVPYEPSAGFVVHSTEVGVDVEKKPILWKAEKAFKTPPVFAGLLGFGPHYQFDSAQMVTWGCQPEPLILYVTWNGGGTEEFYRLANQSFSKMRVMDPNTGVTSAKCIYSAQLIASGRGQFANFNYPPPSFFGTMRSSGGAALGYFGSYIDVKCHDNKPFNIFKDFDPGLYDLISGGTWYLTGGNIDRC
ncbi:hypothetical protein FRZ61_24570 [Hypericibacter adhaerens]|jgi:hypothetical protein|uniref:Uncharacterized protein n=1 Tax=Hypericibacter adhaerens TaxID=2602016 RepID=A0A5J6N0P8_9PROT|nr:hypothetical protein [Hypericibacter adhaerens]QEX22525.1 hypothetical protein FRZ61_24570 [Hypericibacter adhaerens]HVY52091.1 hypothetical protein [Devosia sp.]